MMVPRAVLEMDGFHGLQPEKERERERETGAAGARSDDVIWVQWEASADMYTMP